MIAKTLSGLVGRVLVAAWVSACALAQANPNRLVLTTEEYPPYNMSGPGGSVSGISTDIVRQLLGAAGFEYEISVYPWARAIELARSQANTCVYSMSRTPEREALYRWVGPLVFNDWALFARTGSSRPQSLEALKTLRIGSYEGDAIVGYLQSRGHRVDVAPNDDLNPRKLLAGRIDFWATGRLIGQYRLKQQGVDGLEPVLNFNRTEMYLACHVQLPDAQVQLLNQTLRALEKSGAIKKIYASYGYTP